MQPPDDKDLGDTQSRSIVDLFQMKPDEVSTTNFAEIEKSVEKYRRTADEFDRRLGHLHKEALLRELQRSISHDRINLGDARGVTQLVMNWHHRVPLSLPYLTPEFLLSNGIDASQVMPVLRDLDCLHMMRFLVPPHPSQLVLQPSLLDPVAVPQMKPPPPPLPPAVPIRVPVPTPEMVQIPTTIEGPPDPKKVRLADVPISQCPYLADIKAELSCSDESYLTKLGPCSKFKHHLYFCEVADSFEKKFKTAREAFYKQAIVKKFNVYSPAISVEEGNIDMPQELSEQGIAEFFDSMMGPIELSMKTEWGKRQWLWFKKKQIHDIRKNIMEKRRRKRVRVSDRNVGPGKKRVKRVVAPGRETQTSRPRDHHGRFMSFGTRKKGGRRTPPLMVGSLPVPGVMQDVMVPSVPVPPPPVPHIPDIPPTDSSNGRYSGE